MPGKPTQDGPNTYKMAAPSDITGWAVIQTTRNAVADDGRGMTLRDEWWHIPTFVVEAIEQEAAALPPVAPDLDVETLAQAILNVKYPEVSRLANDGERTAAGWVAAEYRRIQGDKLAEDHGG